MLKNVIVITWILLGARAHADSQEETVRIKLESLNQMRESLASSLIGQDRANITEETFKKVCQPVGMEFKKWGKEQAYEVRQIAEKNRNPAAALSPEEKLIFAKFKSDKRMNFLGVASTEGKGGTVYYQRIPVAKSCLVCHGEKMSRPQFILEKYPDDKAFGFIEGDLRGLYRVKVIKAPSRVQ